MVTYKPGDFIIKEGEIVENLFFIVEGAAYGYKNWDTEQPDIYADDADCPAKVLKAPKAYGEECIY